MKKISKWANKKLKKMNWVDIKLIKLGTAAFTLLIAKIWPPILSLNWEWYLLIAIVAMIRPIKKALVK